MRRRHFLVALLSLNLSLAAGFTSPSHVIPPINDALSSSSTSLSASAGGASSASDTDALTKGRLVEFTTGSGAGKSTALGAILGPDGKRNLRILTSSGRTASVPPRDVKHVVPNSRSISKEEQIAKHEMAAAAALEDDATTGGRDVAEVWEMLLEDDAGVVELTTLADLIVGDDSSESCYAARLVLADGAAGYCFKEISAKGSKLLEENRGTVYYEPRPPDVVENLRSIARAKAEEDEKWDGLKNRIDEACNRGIDSPFNIEAETEEVQEAFQRLQRLGCLANLSPDDAEREERAAIGDDAEAIAAAKEFLTRLGRRSTPESARSLLIGSGIWNVHTNLDMIRLRVPTAFDPSLEELANELVIDPPPDADETTRRDLTHLPAFAIDEASTREVDDALSVEILTGAETEGGGPLHTQQRLWVHIADASRYVELGSPLDREARRRASSLYLPTGTVPMFPMSLASGPLSLTPGEVSCALSVGLMLDADGGIDESSPPVITPSLVRTTRLTYEEVDRLLDPFALVNDDDDQGDGSDTGTIEDLRRTTECLRRLEYASEQRLQWRKDGGSLESIGPYELPDMLVKAWESPDEPDGWGVEIIARERFAASRIVTELMLAANEAIAMYGEANDIPMPYRCQSIDEVTDLELDATPQGPCRSWLAIRSTTKTQILSEPQPHGGLGLDLYVQATSPIRRYADLALHHQIKAHLRGDVLPFLENDADGENDGTSTKRISSIVRLAQDGGKSWLERPANDYWLREFLQRRKADSTEVLVLGGDRWKDDIYKLLLPELGAIITYRSSRSLAIGSQIDIPSSALAEFV